MRKRVLIVAIAILLLLVTTQDIPNGPKHYVYVPALAKGYRAPKFSEKKGVGLQYNHCEDVARLGASWSYNWYPQPDCNGIPMIFQPGEYGIPLYGDRKHLLVFNELDRPIWYYTPHDAAIAWHEIESIYPNRLLIGPAVSHFGLSWLQEFHNAYVTLYGREPRWYALAIHCYTNSYDTCRAVVQQTINWADEWGVSGGVWMTEFAFNPDWEWGAGDMEDATRFVQWMEEHPRVARYAWFTNRTSGEEEWAGRWTPLFEYQSGHITDWGVWYSQMSRGIIE